MRMIHKFILNEGETVLSLPIDAKPVHVENQYGQICLWVELDPYDNNKIGRHFKTFSTGHIIDDFADMEISYVGTALMEGGSYVVHVYEGKIS